MIEVLPSRHGLALCHLVSAFVSFVICSITTSGPVHRDGDFLCKNALWREISIWFDVKSLASAASRACP